MFSTSVFLLFTRHRSNKHNWTCFRCNYSIWLQHRVVHWCLHVQRFWLNWLTWEIEEIIFAYKKWRKVLKNCRRKYTLIISIDWVTLLIYSNISEWTWPNRSNWCKGYVSCYLIKFNGWHSYLTYNGNSWGLVGMSGVKRETPFRLGDTRILFYLMTMIKVQNCSTELLWTLAEFRVILKKYFND